VASGIGITAAVSSIVSLGATRSVNLIWVCRDADLVEFYLSKLDFEDDAWSFIFYTGQRPLILGQRHRNKRVLVILGRPNLDDVICGIVDNVTNGKPLPAELLQRAEEAADSIYNKTALQSIDDALERATLTYYSTSSLLPSYPPLLILSLPVSITLRILLVSLCVMR
jgi:hypothetical protein